MTNPHAASSHGTSPHGDESEPLPQGDGGTWSPEQRDTTVDRVTDRDPEAEEASDPSKD